MTIQSEYEPRFFINENNAWMSMIEKFVSPAMQDSWSGCLV